MAKLKQQDVVDFIETLPIETQISLYNLIKETVSKNLSNHQLKLQDEADNAKMELERINPTVYTGV